MLRGTIFLIALFSAVATTAIAQDPGPAQPEAVQPEPEPQDEDPTGNERLARSSFELGQLAFDEARFEDALRDFERAFALSSRPDLLFNIGIANERLLNWEATVDAFTRYLREVPEAENRSNVEARLRLAQQRQEAERTDDARELSEGSGPPIGGWITVALGGALAIGGGMLLGVGVVGVDDAQSTPPNTRQWTDVESDLDSATTLRTLGAVGLSVGLTAAIGGLLWLMLGGDDTTAPATAQFGGGVIRW